MKDLLYIIALTVITSCIIIPVPHYVKQGRTQIDATKISFIKNDKTLREEVLMKLGEPDGVAINEKVFIYHWTNVVAWMAVGGAGGGTAAAATGDIKREEFFLVGFNENNTVKKTEIINHNITRRKLTLYEYAKDWYEK